MTEWRPLSLAELDEVARECPPPGLEPSEALQRTMWGLECLIRGEPHNRPDLYTYIPLPYDEFIEGLSHCGEPDGRRFLDVGCGIGTKCLLAQNLGWRVEGIEIHQPYLDLAHRLLPAAPLHLADADLFDRYGEFDCIACYHPHVDDEPQAVLVKHIVNQAKSGAFLFLPMWDRDVDGCTKVAASVWQVM